jgi:hypothetical protein
MQPPLLPTHHHLDSRCLHNQRTRLRSHHRRRVNSQLPRRLYSQRSTASTNEQARVGITPPLDVNLTLASSDAASAVNAVMHPQSMMTSDAERIHSACDRMSHVPILSIMESSQLPESVMLRRTNLLCKFCRNRQRFRFFLHFVSSSVVFLFQPGNKFNATSLPANVTKSLW